MLSSIFIGECGCLIYDAHAADLLFEIVNHRHGRNSIVLATHKLRTAVRTVYS
jgi:hypothetical protein